jgi:Methyltransferase domain
MKTLTLGNVQSHVMRSQDFFASFDQPIKFCHIDASHDYPSVKAEIEAALRLLLSGGILCGDDFQSASAQRADLQGGVERAVRELLGGFQSIGNFWFWQKPYGRPSDKIMHWLRRTAARLVGPARLRRRFSSLAGVRK